uniref:Reverse transcriptase zinc-binding domain-containing protein n=1 Tax=Aegilops tauschii subsp. strangulata TaxID=200361 RepID=A0A453FU27_AEGTS
KVMIFGWLFYLDRLNTRQNLRKKTILDSDVCPRCNSSVEDRVHLFFSCPAARRIWQRLGLQPLAAPIDGLFSTTLPSALPDTVRPFMLLLILWKIWDARNKKVFQNLELDASQTLRAILDDLITWSHRLRTETLKGYAGLWRDFLSSRNL